MKRIRFLYIPARSPHWGGVYERLIGLTKTSLKKILGRSLVTLQELHTLIKEIQAILNDRPLTTLNADLNDLQPLTPSHLLFGFHITALPHLSLDTAEYDPSFGDANAISRAQQRRTFLYNAFKQRFQKEYLSLLREIHSYQTKKSHAAENVVQVGDVVLIADDDMPRHRWELGVVEKLLTGADHLCRSVAIRTSKGHTTRSLVKLYPVELNAVDCFKDVNKGIDLQLAPDEDTQATRVPRTAAITARDPIVAQLIDSDQD